MSYSGDSYSDVGYWSGHPTPYEPLAVPFPGKTYAEPDLPNWVGHLITKYCPSPRYCPDLPDEEQDEEYVESPLLIYDYAVGGNTVSGIAFQIDNVFLPSLKETPVPQWCGTDTLFVTWIGINDCGKDINPSAVFEALFAAQEKLLKAGARNFLFVDVPPIHRTPNVAEGKRQAIMSYRYIDWNLTLTREVAKFAKAHKDISVFLFSSYELFERMLNNPPAYDIDPEELEKPGGQVWVDELHPTSKMHDHIAAAIATFLNAVKVK
ncbi:hypothetical protein NLJ89_g6751 [Agrocybe chaxingu]|uniref:Carbohydrate esterase family 16 protein n=1 Tax=Agrocybe chaxingu TaxID=84603 RepID=A0A9W8JY06_9AGAR|nr:hypothetical protein NLJ89_g6751 [Agrocybe chaxingu]